MGSRCLCLLAFVAVACMAQSDRGQIKGTVTDSSGLAVAGARVTLLNTSTGVRTESSSTATGDYVFPALVAGSYEISTEVQGFKKFSQTGVQVDVGRTISVDVVLQPGAVQESITVDAKPPMLDLQTSDTGTAVTRRQIQDLPMPLTSDSRNPLNFVILTPGVSGSVPGSTPDLRLHISGSPTSSAEVYIDGVPIADTGANGDISTNHPSIDAIGEFRISNNSQAAEYGLASGIISFTFRSGSNDLHGSIYEYFQNEKLNALDFPTKTLGGSKAPLKQNEYGFTLGGPVTIPKLYSGRDRTFFFTSFTGFRYRPSSNNLNLTTFPNRFRQGDFSQLLGAQLTAPNPQNPSQNLPVVDAAGRPIISGAIYDPTQSRVVTGPDGRQYTIRDPFAGNIIPANYAGLSRVSKQVLAQFPQAATDALFNNFFRTTRSIVDQERFVGKIDQAISSRQTLSGSVFIGTNTNSSNGALNLLDAQSIDSPSTQIRLSHTFTISPRVINNFNFGFLRDRFQIGPVDPGPSFATLGLTGISLPPGSAFPSIGIRNQNSIGSGGTSLTVQNRFVGSDSVTWVNGSHSFKFGGEFRRLQRNEVPNNAGNYVFESTQTALNGTGFVQTSSGPVAVNIPAGTGSSAASFLFGAPDFSRFDLGYTTAGYRWWTFGGYGQDDWRVTRNLTLNLGLRYDLAIPRTEVLGRVSTVDVSLPNPAAGGIRGAYTFYGNGPGRNGKARIGDIDKTMFQPRIGMAYSPRFEDGFFGRLLGKNDTVFRSGFAITRPLGNDTLTNGISGGLYSAGFNGVATVNRPGDTLGSPAFFWDQAFPNFTPPPTLDPGLLVGNVNPALIYPESGKPPTQINWNFEIQRSFPGSMVFSAAYVGMHTYHLGIWRKPNQVDPALAAKYANAAAAAGLPLNQFLALGINDPRASAAGIQAPFPSFVSLFGSAATVGQALRPFPQYGNIDNLMVPLGSTSYNGLQTRLQKRFEQGLTFLLAYTFSKTIGDVDSINGALAGAENNQFSASFQQDYYNNRAERSVTSSDVPHVLAMSYTYELPFGPGKPFANHKGAVGRIVGGWQFSAIHLYQSGRPLHIEYQAFGADNPYKANDGFSFRPNIVPGQPLLNPSYDPKCSGPLPASAGRSPCQFYINPAAFTAPPSGQFGNAPKLLAGLRTPMYLNEDFSISKRTAITEKVDVQFLANFFNVFNRVVLGTGGPQTTIYNLAPKDLSSASLANSNTPFGILTAQQNGPRRIQLALKVEF